MASNAVKSEKFNFRWLFVAHEGLCLSSLMSGKQPAVSHFRGTEVANCFLKGLNVTRILLILCQICSQIIINYPLSCTKCSYLIKEKILFGE